MFGLPNLNDHNLRPTSPATAEYNCLAWALHSTIDQIWPDEDEQLSWPPDMQRAETVQCIQEFLERVGFEVCTGRHVEQGYEKIALYADSKGPQHFARQLPNGAWTSKLGDLVDGEHSTLAVLEGGQFGSVAKIFKRKTDGSAPSIPPLRPERPRLIDQFGNALLGGPRHRNL
jgi:hypothetical protein